MQDASTSYSIPTLVDGGQDHAPGGDDPTLATVEEPIGAVLVDRYRIVDKLGEGGMAAVYLAEHVTIGKRCAVKILFPEHAHRQELVDRFLQEARASSMIEHENVVEITDFGQAPGGTVFFVMELLQGEDLADTIARGGRMPWPRVQGIARQITGALAAAHERGVVHRDLKPENCFRVTRAGTDDFIKVLDFGIAKITSEVDEEGRGLTRTGSIFGSPEYMSPEQAAGERVDHRADIYSLGVILYELVTGRTPFTAETYMGYLTKHMYEAPIPPRDIAPEAAIPLEAEAVILKALQKDRELRFADMDEFAAAIAAVGTGVGPVEVIDEGLSIPGAAATGRSRRLVVAAFVAGILCVALVVGFVIGSGGEAPPEPVPEAPAVVAPVEVALPEVKAAPEPAEVKVTIETNVAADVLDARDRRVLGNTGEPGGVTLPRGEEARALVLRADDHVELEIEVTPDKDHAVHHELERAKKQRTRRKKRRGKSSKKRSAFELRPDPFAKKKGK